LSEWFLHNAIHGDSIAQTKLAAMAHSISQTLTAVAILNTSPDGQEQYDDILDKLIPIERTVSVKTYEFIG
jgi:ribulose-5-phosphate 4-epimerase/fuculose-1-phosphate aldolase